jgi:hypothetical protein
VAEISTWSLWLNNEWLLLAPPSAEAAVRQDRAALTEAGQSAGPLPRWCIPSRWRGEVLALGLSVQLPEKTFGTVTGSQSSNLRERAEQDPQCGGT